VAVRSVIVLVVALALVLVTTSCSSEDDSNGMTGSAVEPVGPCRIAFRVRNADYPDAPSDIHVINPDGTGQRNLTRTGTVFEVSPVWSPDGRKIAFTAQGSDLSATHIYVVNADGSGRRQLTHPRPDRAYSQMGTWSRDGRVIFYTRQDLSGNLSSWAMNADGSDKRRIQGFNNASPSPDGHYVAGTRNSGVESDYYGSPDVYVVKSNDDDRRWLTRTGDTEFSGWSPDGDWILYKRWAGAAGLYVVKPDGSDRKRLTHDSDDYNATWSADGESILYTSQSPAEGIHIVALTDGPPQRLTRKVNDLSPGWSSGGTRIVFGRSFGIWMMNRDGTDIRSVAQPGGPEVYESPAWSPACK
jgi:TolB protein